MQIGGGVARLELGGLSMDAGGAGRWAHRLPRMQARKMLSQSKVWLVRTQVAGEAQATWGIGGTGPPLPHEVE